MESRQILCIRFASASSGSIQAQALKLFGCYLKKEKYTVIQPPNMDLSISVSMPAVTAYVYLYFAQGSCPGSVSANRDNIQIPVCSLVSGIPDRESSSKEMREKKRSRISN